MKHYYFIVNPVSGNKNVNLLLDQISDFMNRKNESFEIKLTEKAGHAIELSEQVKQNKNYVVVSVGGDGSLNEIGRGLVGGKASIGIIPVGSGNGLARHLGISLNVTSALQQLLSEKEIKMDVGFLNDQPFLVTAGIGFDAEVAYNFAKRKTRGLLGYVKETIKLYPGYTANMYKITSPEIETTVKAFSITIANSSQYGNDAVIAHEARVDDGLLDLCVIKSYPKVFGPQIGLNLFIKNLHNSKFYETIKTKSITIESSDLHKTCNIHIDGESIRTNYPVTIRIQEGAIRLVVPK